MAKVDLFECVADGVIVVHAGGGPVARVNTAKNLAYVMKTYGLADETKIKGGNGLPFDDLIIDEALEIYNWEVNGIAG